MLLIDAGFEEYDDYRVIIARTDGDTREVVMSRDGLAASLVEGVPRVPVALTGETLTVGNYEIELFGRMMDWPADREYRITSYNVCYTKLLRSRTIHNVPSDPQKY